MSAGRLIYRRLLMNKGRWQKCKGGIHPQFGFGLAGVKEDTSLVV